MLYTLCRQGGCRTQLVILLYLLLGEAHVTKMKGRPLQHEVYVVFLKEYEEVML